MNKRMINLNKGFYTVLEEHDIFGLGLAFGYVPYNKDFQITILLGNMSLSIGYIF